MTPETTLFELIRMGCSVKLRSPRGRFLTVDPNLAPGFLVVGGWGADDGYRPDPRLYSLDREGLVEALNDVLTDVDEEAR